MPPPRTGLYSGANFPTRTSDTLIALFSMTARPLTESSTLTRNWPTSSWPVVAMTTRSSPSRSNSCPMLEPINSRLVARISSRMLSMSKSPLRILLSICRRASVSLARRAFLMMMAAWSARAANLSSSSPVKASGFLLSTLNTPMTLFSSRMGMTSSLTIRPSAGTLYSLEHLSSLSMSPKFKLFPSWTAIPITESSTSKTRPRSLLSVAALTTRLSPSASRSQPPWNSVSCEAQRRIKSRTASRS